MPRLYAFDGWSIYMYFKDHEPPHIHLIKDGKSVVFSIYGELLNGNTKGINMKNLKGILDRNKSILESNWELMKNEGRYQKLI